MRATVMYGAGDVRTENVPDPKVQASTDAVVRVLRSCICGSDLWPYGSMPAAEHGRRIGHEFLGVVDDLGADVSGLRRGDLVVAPFMWADNTCDYCSQGLQTSCRHGGQWGVNGVDGGQGEAVRVPQAQGTLVKLPVGEDSALLPSLLTLSDVFCRGHHCAVTAGVNPRTTVTVIGDGAVGLSAVLAAKRLGAERILLMGADFGVFMRNITLTGGVAPARAYIEELLPDVLGGTIEPGKVFDRTVSLDHVSDGYRAMADREALKVLVRS